MLEGKTILIGKEPGNGRLLIAVKGGDSVKTAAIGNSGCVPDSVSRCKPAEDAAHCKLTIDASGAIILTNLKDRNVTFVNDREIVSKQVTPDNRIALGKDKYSINLNSILELAEKIICQSSTQNQQRQTEVSIKHLKLIWDNYDKAILKLEEEQFRKGQQRQIQGILSLIGTGVLFIPGVNPNIRGITLVCALGIATYLFIKGARIKNAPHNKKRELQNKLKKEYVCPNCKHYLEREYEILRQDKKCRYCGCKYSEK